MPDWPKMIIFLPKNTDKDAVEFEWHRALTEKAGSRMVVLALVNHTEQESGIMKIFNINSDSELPACKVIKPGSVDLDAGKIEAYESKVNPWEWTLDKMEQLMEHTWLPVKTQMPAKTTDLLSKWHIHDQTEFYHACVKDRSGKDIGGRCGDHILKSHVEMPQP